MGISVFPAPVTVTGGLALRKITSAYSTPQNQSSIPTQQSSGTATGGACVKFANSTWVMIQPGGRISTSTDRLTWSNLHNNINAEIAKYIQSYVVSYRPTYACKSLEFANGTWVAYFSNSLVMKSTDLVTWTVVLDLNLSTNNLGTGSGLGKVSSTGTVAWNGTANLWIVVSAAPAVYTSPDLTTWTDRLAAYETGRGSTGTGINKVIWANQLFIAVDAGGLINTSPDALTWTLRTAVFGGTAANDIATNGLGSNASATTVIVAAAGKWAYSTNGTTWTANTANSTKVHTNVVYDGNRFVVNSTTAAEAYYSSNGIGGLAATATPTSLTAGVALAQQIATNGSGQVFIGTVTGFIGSSDVSVSWNTFSTIVNLGTTSQTTIDAQSDNRKYSCVDGAGKIWLTQKRLGRVFVSSDAGSTWTFHNSALTQFTNTTVESHITFTGLWYLNGNLFAADTAGGLKVSSDNGATWSARLTGFTNNIIGMAYGNGVYIAICPNAVGSSSTTSVFRSTNATTWTAVSTGSTGGATSKCFYNATATTYDTAIPRTIVFVDDNTPGYFEILADIGDSTATVGTKSVNGIYWIDGINGTLDAGGGGSVSYQIDINPATMTPSSTTTITATSTQAYNHYNTITSIAKGGLQAKNADGKTMLFLRFSTGTANQTLGYIVYRTNSHIQASRSNYQAVKVNGAAPFLNIEGLPANSNNWSSNFEPIYLNYHANIGWVAAYYANNSTMGNYNIVASSDGISWDVIATIPARYDSATNENVYVFTNEVDKVFVSVIQNSTATNSSFENFYVFPVTTQPAIA
jgi:hypothetical protein